MFKVIYVSAEHFLKHFTAARKATAGTANRRARVPSSEGQIPPALNLRLLTQLALSSEFKPQPLPSGTHAEEETRPPHFARP